MTEERWYDNTPGWILLYEEAFLEALARTLPENSKIINIGSAVGTSSSAIMRGVQHLDNVNVISIDIEDCPQEIEMLKTRGLYDESRFYQVQGNSTVVVREINYELDMVFVDGSHSYEGTLADLEAYAPLLKPGGLMVCHDHGDSRQLDCSKAIDAWILEYIENYTPWFMVGHVLYTTAFKKPGAGPDWHKGRLDYE